MSIIASTCIVTGAIVSEPAFGMAAYNSTEHCALMTPEILVSMSANMVGSLPGGEASRRVRIRSFGALRARLRQYDRLTLQC